jgi:hypothetical protein
MPPGITWLPSTCRASVSVTSRQNCLIARCEKRWTPKLPLLQTSSSK